MLFQTRWTSSTLVPQGQLCCHCYNGNGIVTVLFTIPFAYCQSMWNNSVCMLIQKHRHTHTLMYTHTQNSHLAYWRKTLAIKNLALSLNYLSRLAYVKDLLKEYIWFVLYTKLHPVTATGDIIAERGKLQCIIYLPSCNGLHLKVFTVKSVLSWWITTYLLWSQRQSQNVSVCC